jgi:alpha-beta hydrolase superfamily lysophospholipase
VCEWKDETVPPKAIIFAIHGATLYAKTFDEVARHFASEGYPFYALDMRGFGRWRKESATFGGDTGIHYTQTKMDILEALGMLRRTNPNLKIYCLGESLGANLAVWLVTNKPELTDGAILSSPCIKRFLHPRPRLISDFTKSVLHPYRGYDMMPHIQPYLSDDKRVTAEYVHDPMINSSFSAADLIKSMRTNRETLLGADKIGDSMPLLVVAGKLDQVYKTSAIPEFMKRVGSKDKTIFIEPNKGHLLLETGHTEPKILAVIDKWLTQESTNKPDGIKTSSLSVNGATASLNEKESAPGLAPGPTADGTNAVIFVKSTQAKVILKEKNSDSASKEISVQNTSSKSANRIPD